MENRGQKYHRERLVEAFKEELITILGGELGDPRIGLVTVTEVMMGEGGKSLHVYVSVEGSEDEERHTLDGLASATGFIRHELAENLSLRQAPELFFHIDRSQQYGDRIEKILHRIEKRKRNKLP